MPTVLGESSCKLRDRPATTQQSQLGAHDICKLTTCFSFHIPGTQEGIEWKRHELRNATMTLLNAFWFFFFFNIESLVYALKVLMQHLHVPKRLLQQMKNKSVWVLTYQVNRENCHRRRVGYYRNRIGGHRCFHCYSMMRPLDRAWMNCYRHRLRHLQSDCDEMKKNVDESTMMKTDLADDGGGGGDARGDFLYFLIQIIYY